jgi:hypothetical protein
MGFLEKLTSMWRRGSPVDTIQTGTDDRPDTSPMSYSTEEIRETDHLYRMLQIETDRRAILRDVERMLREDSLIDETNDRLARKAVRGGIIVSVTGSGSQMKRVARKTGDKPGSGMRLANQAQEIINDLLNRCNIDAHSKLWVSRVIADGDLFLNVVIRNYDSQPKIEQIKYTPAMIMKRNENQFGQFIDTDKAFSEIDPIHNGLYFSTIIPDNAVKHFPLWSINHIRWKYRGGMYGNSQYATIRKLSRQNGAGDDDMVVRRKVRAPLRRAHMIGNKDNPAEPKTVDKYKADHKESIVNGKYTPITDYFMNGIGDVKNLEGDGNLDKIADVKYLYDKENIGTLIPKGLIGHAEDINRDVLDDQKEEYYDSIEDIRHLLEYGDGGPFSGLRAIINFELLLHGIDVDASGLSYDLSFRPLRNDKPLEVIDRTIKARDSKLIDQRTAVMNIAHIFNVEDPEMLLKALEQEGIQDKANKAKLDKGGDGHEVTNSVGQSIIE